jgi:hypothetical protein
LWLLCCEKCPLGVSSALFAVTLSSWVSLGIVHIIYSRRVRDREIGNRNERGIETQDNMAPEIWRGRRRGRIF